VVNAIIDCAKAGKPLAMHMHRDPTRLIKIHSVLVRFEMRKEADVLLEELWTVIGSKELRLADVSWIWDTFADPIKSRWGRNDYVAPAAEKYVQMMAWQIVNMDAAGKLNHEIQKTIEMEKEPRYFFDTLKTRLQKYGLGREPLPSANKTAQAVTSAPTALEEPTPKEQFSVYRKPSPSSPAHKVPTKAPALSQGVVSPSLNRNPLGKLISVGQTAPKFTSAGFMKSIELPKPSVSQRPAPAFGQPDKKADLWSGRSYKNAFEMWYGTNTSIATNVFGSKPAMGSNSKGAFFGCVRRVQER
jgi:hypothetical protein